MKHQSDSTHHIERANNDRFDIFKLKILMVIDKTKEKKKRADIDPIHSFIV